MACPECGSLASQLAATGEGLGGGRCLTCGTIWEDRDNGRIWIIRRGRKKGPGATEADPELIPEPQRPEVPGDGPGD